MAERITTTPSAIGWYRAHARVWAHYGQPGGAALCSQTRHIPPEAERIADSDWQQRCGHCTKKHGILRRQALGKKER